MPIVPVHTLLTLRSCTLYPQRILAKMEREQRPASFLLIGMISSLQSSIRWARRYTIPQHIWSSLQSLLTFCLVHLVDDDDDDDDALCLGVSLVSSSFCGEPLCLGRFSFSPIAELLSGLDSAPHL